MPPSSFNPQPDPPIKPNPTSASSSTFNPQPDPPVGTTPPSTFNPQPDPPIKPNPTSASSSTFNPQPDPPVGTTLPSTFNPQPDPPIKPNPTSASSSTFNPQPDPPVGTTLPSTFNPQPDPPIKPNPTSASSSTFNPQPDPPVGTTPPSTFNPQPDPPIKPNPTSASSSTFNPQPDPPVGTTLPSTFNPQPDPPIKPNPTSACSSTFNPQPDPPVGTTPPSTFNPQPDPPGLPSPLPSGIIDTQHKIHGPSYAYSHTTYPAFYDAWVDSMFSPPTPSPSPIVGKNEDIPIFEEFIRDQLAAKKASLMITTDDYESESCIVNIVDLGTGTGRVICEIIRGIYSATAAEEDLKKEEELQQPKMNFWGVDHSPSMLSHAENRFSQLKLDYETKFKQSIPSTPLWICASASTFQTILSSSTTPKQRLNQGELDLLFMSVGTIHHLVDPNEVLAFLMELARGLKAGTGRAVVSVLDEMVPGEGEGGGVEYSKGENQIIKAKGGTGEIYVKSPTITSEEVKVVEVDVSIGDGEEKMLKVNSQRRIDKWTVGYYDGLPEGWEKVGKSPAEMVEEGKGRNVWTKEMEWSLAVWDEDVFRALVGVARLEVLEVRRGVFQRWYVLGKKRVG
ncbi:hypothetical protein L211DRAFT_832037 [Terfezia boudieri ATCC MYA-4762]|uniref:Methyltransferase domain-containing protein n=1 Tax=Terfezia boudieri ATCC MYA-4762 TaxID=1051890 RepID=A0A3N4M6A2_9PEZI|nr:hypothetical protein L211DRAFT_832037 [Terfezia boudieri ATCC MYA-4762]